MHSVSSIPQRPIYTLPVQVMAAAVTAAAVAIILTQPLTSIGLIVLCGAGGATLVAFVVATVAAGRYSKQEKEATRSKGAAEGGKPVAPKPKAARGKRAAAASKAEAPKPAAPAEMILPASIKGLYAGIDSLFGGLIGAECKSRGVDATKSENNFSTGFKAIIAILGPRAVKVTETKMKKPLVPILVSAYNFGSPRILQEVKDDINGTLVAADLTPEQRQHLIARTIISMGMVINLLKVLLTLEGNECRKQLDHIHLQLTGLIGIANYQKSKEEYCGLIDLQIQNGNRVYFLNNPDKTDEALALIQKVYKKAKVNIALSEEGRIAIDCPVEESPIKPLTRIPKFFASAAIAIVEPLIPNIIKYFLVGGGFADEVKDADNLTTIKEYLPEVLIPFLQNAYLKNTKFRKKFADILSTRGDGWITRLGNIPHEKGMDENLMVAEFQAIVKELGDSLTDLA
ncbi:MAG: hypothetical protein KR126chlam2_00871 [Chlamydiae bacterium]|nr:hypothetical protein [Chlamydiota bacterium]